MFGCNKHSSLGYAALLFALPGLALAQLGDTPQWQPPPTSYPTAAITLIVGDVAGSATDGHARFLAKELTKEFGKRVSVENKPGAHGTLASEAVRKSAADGYTLLFTNTSHSINFALYADKLKYNPVDDFTPISLFGMAPLVLVAHPSVTAGDAKALIEAAKEKKNKLQIAVAGRGSSSHMASEHLKQRAGVDVESVVVADTAAALAEVLAGKVALTFLAVGEAQAHLKSGKLKALGLTGVRPATALPDVAPLIGTLPGYDFTAFYGLIAPPKLPVEILIKLNTAATKAAKLPEAVARMEAEGGRAVGSRADGFYTYVKHDMYKWQKLAKEAGVKLE